MTLHLYGIVRADHCGLPPDGGRPGERHAPVRLLTAGELAAAVSDAPAALAPRRRSLSAHHRVVEELSRRGTVLPLPFGSLWPDEEAVLTALEDRAAYYLGQLARLDGKVEYNVKAGHHEEAILHQVLSEDAELRARTQRVDKAGGGTYRQRLELGELLARAVRERERRDTVTVHDTLAPAADEVSRWPESKGWPADISFLVDRARVERFLGLLDSLARSRPQLELRTDGPLPPYSFTGRTHPGGSGRHE
ncbi:GvpL/GvpF family gas vesicle protein [Streptomyces beihaiensis]|uniref:GvpL/GvpF family gas vesicle protein n=1 Tax=Streptomyces beihaiensis TaxID=2984495 RepID=A0ABT3TXF9_9ACTN|nr:GvpL/GvpF family gas vesicle protein [Streptomyces beihaiensis]MCX3061734.1 GvpL/GvpF family gas vesicle protein [Streptomyces beihaiensis]